MAESRTQQAVLLLKQNPGMSQYEAARRVGIAQATLSKAVATLRAKEELARKIEQGGYL